MIRKILTVLLTAAIFLSCALGLSACSDGKDGADGKDGVGVSNAYIDENGDLILVFTDGTQKNCGNAVQGSGENLFYSAVEDDGEIIGYCVRSVGSISGTEIIIPSEYRGLPVMAVSDGAFADCGWIKKVVIPDSVLSVGENAFYDCTALKSVEIGDGVTQIGGKAFYNCNGLESVSFGKSVEFVGGTAFGKCFNLESVYITDVGAWCGISFENLSATPMYFATELYINNKLATQIVIPDGVTTIGNYAFYECSNITDVKTGGGVTQIGDSAFYNCENLKSVTVGNGVTQIGDSAFLSCINLEKATIGNKVNLIDDYAFAQCCLLREILVPASVERIGESAFAECSSLSKITLNNGLKTIGDSAFCGCALLNSFIMPNSVTEIGTSVLMFGGGGGFIDGDASNGLTELGISNSLTVIPDFAFSKTNITSVKIGDGVKTIKYSSFYGCAMLQSVVIPKGVSKIESFAFYRCDSLEKVYFGGTESEWEEISIGKNGNDIRDAKRYYYSETQPETAGNFWRYVNGVVTEW